MNVHEYKHGKRTNIIITSNCNNKICCCFVFYESNKPTSTTTTTNTATNTTTTTTTAFTSTTTTTTTTQTFIARAMHWHHMAGKCLEIIKQSDETENLTDKGCVSRAPTAGPKRKVWKTKLYLQ